MLILDEKELGHLIISNNSNKYLRQIHECKKCNLTISYYIWKKYFETDYHGHSW